MIRIVLFISLMLLLHARGQCEDVTFQDQVRPILVKHCVSCHGARTTRAGLRLDAASLIHRGGESGRAVVAGKPNASLILERITSKDEDLRMPAEAKPLSAREIDVIRRWILDGAHVPPDEVIPARPEDHWAWKVPRISPRLDDGQNPIDAYFEDLFRKRGITPRPMARRDHLLRRVSLDLTGLPPTRKQLHEFLARPGQETYEDVVDALLASPHHGERWGRHWMDIWRYTDWFGLGKEVRYSQKSIWRWRDWIVESLNDDLGYDRMVQDMLAADELAPLDRSRLRATGFLTRNFHLFNRNYWLEDVVEHTAKSFMGLTLNCCRCHNHKYDPLDQDEYYSWRAFFEPYQVRLDPLTADPSPDAPAISRVYDADLDVKTQLFIRGDEKNPDAKRKILAVVPRIFGDSAAKTAAVNEVRLPVTGWYPALAPTAVAEAARAIQERADARRDEKQKLVKRVGRLAERLAAAKTNPKAGPLFEDTFKTDRPKDWETFGRPFEITAAGLLNKNLTGGQSRYICRHMPPRNFVATSRFRITGGATRSIGLIFDIKGDEQFNVYISPSGNQVSFTSKSGNQQVYPARTRLEVKNGVEYEVTIAVRDRLVNAWVNGKFQLAVEVPRPRRMGRLAVSTYEASAEFLGFAFGDLDSAERLFKTAEAGKGSPPPQVVASAEALRRSLDRLALDQAIVDHELLVLELESAALRARAQAERVKYELEKGEADTVAREAARAEHQHTLARIKTELMIAERDLATALLREKPGTKSVSKAVTELQKKVDGLRKNLQQNMAKKPTSSYQPLGKQFPRRSTGRRSALARWITSRDNPLTSRVAVNHIWARHFGQPLVGSMFDFGIRTPRPQHLELLDHLATRFMENRWSMKDLHRVITSSRAYQRESKTDPRDPAEPTDRDNRLFRRMPLKQMEGEILRDSLLALAGRLDRTMGGPVLPSDQADTGHRRTLYYRYARDDRYRMLETFDAASVEECYRRHETVVPQQSLALANSRLVQQLSAAIGERLTNKSDAEFITVAYETILGRQASATEHAVTLEACQKLIATLKRQGADTAAARLDAHRHIAHVLVMHNDFLVIR